MGRRNRATVRPSISKTVPAAGACRNRSWRNHGAGEPLGAVEDGDAAPLYRQGLHEPDRGGHLWRRVSIRPVIDRPARGLDAWGAQSGLPVPASRDGRLDQPAMAVVIAAADAGPDGQ